MNGVRSNFKLLLGNVQSIRNKILEMEVLLKEHNINCFCVNEHWLNNDEFPVTSIAGYTTTVGFSRTVKKHGGVGIYL